MICRNFIFRMSTLEVLPVEGEEARIREAYARRQGGTRYSWFNSGHVFMAQEIERRLLALLARYGFAPLNTQKILEVGCGTGYWLREFIKWGARPENIVGIDLLADRIGEAGRLCPKGVQLQCGSAEEILFPDETFDLVLQSTVFTSVLDSGMKQRMAAEMFRVLKQEGLVLWYDYHVNNPWNPDVRSVRRREIYQLFHGCRIELQRLTLAPPLARFLAPYSWLACYMLAKIPLLCTHYLGVIRKG
jgi:ubiquinone/menaquinone biosynthesis C-methylase UbiE